MPPALIAAGVAAAGSVAGSLISGSSAKSAADTQAAAAEQASANSLKQYEQTRSDLAPYRGAGQGALGVLSNILGIPGAPGPSAAAAPAAPAATAPAGAPQGGGQGQPSLPAGWTITPYAGMDATESGSGSPPGYMVSDAQGNVQGIFQNPQEIYSQFGVWPWGGSGAASGQPAAAAPAATAAPTAPGPDKNTLAAYGLSGLTYQAPAAIQSVLNNPTFQPTQAQLEATPGYQFDLSQGLLGVANSQAAKGLGISGSALKGAAGFATGLANNTLQTQAGIFNQNYTNALNANAQGANIFQSNLGNVINPLEWATNLGQNAAATTGQQGIQAVGNANNALIGGANAQAAGTVGSANALASGLGGLGNSATNYLLFNNMMNGGGGGGGGGYVDNGTWG